MKPAYLIHIQWSFYTQMYRCMARVNELLWILIQLIGSFVRFTILHYGILKGLT